MAFPAFETTDRGASGGLHLDSARGVFQLEKLGWKVEGNSLDERVWATGVFCHEFVAIQVEAESTNFRARRYEDQVVGESKDLLFFTIAEGHGLLRVAGAAQAFKAGQLLLIPCTLPFEFVVKERVSLFVMRSEAHRFSRPEANQAPESVIVIDDEIAVSWLSQALSHFLPRRVPLTYETLTYMRRSVEALIDAAFAAQGNSTRPWIDGSIESLYRRATLIIDNDYDRPELDPSEVAERLEVSRKHLESIFRKNGSTIASLLRQTRARHAKRLLAERERGMPLQLKQIATFSGFANVARMRRAIEAAE